MLVAFAIGLALGVLLTIGSVKMGISAARYIWKHALGLILLLCIIITAKACEPQRRQPDTPRYNDRLERID